MPLVNLKLDNVLAFDDFELNFTYPRKLKRSMIDSEYLKYCNSFNYKKMNIFIGSNSCGKTSLMKVIWNILLYLDKKQSAYITEITNNNGKDFNIELDYVSTINKICRLYRFKIKNAEEDFGIQFAFNSVVLSDKDNYDKASLILDKLEYKFSSNVENLDYIDMNLGWNIVLPATEEHFNKITVLNPDDQSEKKLYYNILNNVFKTLDPSIVSVDESNDSPDACVIYHQKVGKIIAQNGNKLSMLDKLSSGTKYGFNIANIIYSIKLGKNGVYLIDEQFSYVNSDLEKAFISLFATLLRDDEQILITTHNPEVLTLGLPFHSFNFMGKKLDGDELKIRSYCASLVQNKNNVNTKTILDNDMFSTCPDLSKIFEMGD